MRRIMSRWIAIAGIVALCGVGSALADEISLDDVIRLHAAGVSDDIIVSEVIVTGTVFALWPDDIVRLKEAGLSNNLIEFLVDTARDDFSPSDLDYETDDEAEYVPSDDEIEEEESDEGSSTTHFYVGLNYGFSGWWYDHCWWDYWYYDWGYAPYRYSYCWSYGGWYPTWYGGYGCGPAWYASYPYGGYGATYPLTGPAGLSTEKWKSTGGSGRSSVDRLVARTDLTGKDRTRGKIQVGKPVDARDHVLSTRFAKAETKVGGERTRTAKTAVSPRLATKAKAALDARLTPTKKTSGPKVQPASRKSKSTGGDAVRSGSPSGRSASKKVIAPSKSSSKPSRSTAVRPSKVASKRAPSAVRSAPARTITPSRGSAPSVRSAPATRSAPARSAHFRSAPTMRSGASPSFGGSRGRVR